MAEEKSEPEYFAFDSFRWHFNYWTFLGLNQPEWVKPFVYKLYMIFIHFTVNFYLPLSLVLGIFQLRDPEDILQSLVMSFTIVCAMKAYVLSSKIENLRELGAISKEFENKARKNKEEYDLILEFKARSKVYMYAYLFILTILVTTATMSLLTYDTRRLLYPGYFPYNFEDNRLIYVLTAFYQWSAWVAQVYANMHYDTYPGLLIFLLCQHLRILNLRISNIGYNKEMTQEENHVLLREAVTDHRQTIQYYKIVSGATSATNFVMFLSSSFNIVCCVVLMTFFAENIFQKMYLFDLVICYFLETVLSCYYGSEFEVEISNITKSLYSCKWYEQNKYFKQDLSIFLECSLRKYTLMAGGLISVSNDSFVRVVKGTFSLYTLLNGIREKLN